MFCLFQFLPRLAGCMRSIALVPLSRGISGDERLQAVYIFGIDLRGIRRW